MSVDSTHSAHLQELSKKAQQGTDEFSKWAQDAALNPEEVYKQITKKLGRLPVNPPWSIFAKIFHEDTPENIFQSQADFTDRIFKEYSVNKGSLIVDAACGTGGFVRLLSMAGYSSVIGFDQSIEMIAEAKKLGPQATDYFVSSIQNLELSPKADAIIWYDFSSNFALNETQLKELLKSLLKNLKENGVLIFDIRIDNGWEIDFFKQKVTTFSTENFQRIWINLPNFKTREIVFDIFIRTKEENGKWAQWEREQMKEKMWLLNEVRDIVYSLKGIDLIGIYNDQYLPYKEGESIQLAKFVLKKVT
ncbi:MAG: class I SAM-dependent methyltransferase [Candidatus Dojkabacteria bacterium]|nr:MAG: class I SAM-dependent methyltransferase [Candidatus Dojkabacteria bacterium]